MLEIKFVRENPDAVKRDLKKRGMSSYIPLVDELLKADGEYRNLLRKEEGLRKERNELTNEIRKARKQGKDTSKLIERAKALPELVKKAENDKDKKRRRVTEILFTLPNLLDESVPVGRDEEGNVVVKKWGAAKKLPFRGKSHVDLLSSLDVGDLERASKISGARFYILKDQLVKLELALVQFAVDRLSKKGFTIIEPPYMMGRKAYEGVTDLHDFEDVMYKIEGEDLYLIATSEHPLAAMHMNETFDKGKLPLKYAGVSPCFRKEAGSHGKDTKGIFRVHQFIKIEQFIYSAQEDSPKYHEELLRNAEEFYKELGLPYRVVNICTGDIGTVASKKYDIEVWMPIQEKYREVVSCSNCTSYQATRLNIKYRENKGGVQVKKYVHTLNSTAIATTRTMVAIMENFQREDGSVAIPKVLWPYTLGMKEIKRIKGD